MTAQSASSTAEALAAFHIGMAQIEAAALSDEHTTRSMYALAYTCFRTCEDIHMLFHAIPGDHPAVRSAYQIALIHHGDTTP